MAKNRVLPTPDPQDRAPEEVSEITPAVLINPAISKAVFALYEGTRMTKKDAQDARVLAALYQIVFNLATIHAQSIVNTKALLEPPCPGCGK